MMADIEVLAEDTAEVTAGEKYRPRPALTDEDAFLAEVRADGADHRHIADTAKPDLALTALNFALARTEHTGIHHSPQLLHRFAE